MRPNPGTVVHGFCENCTCNILRILLSFFVLKCVDFLQPHFFAQPYNYRGSAWKCVAEDLRSKKAKKHTYLSAADILRLFFGKIFLPPFRISRYPVPHIWWKAKKLQPELLRRRNECDGI